jgi:glycosyltransferase involved in cell wall biosynthesis
MRIGLVAPPWLPVPPPAYGGTEAVVDRLARGLQAAGHEVTLVTTGEATCPVPRRAVLDRSCPDRIGDPAVERFHVAFAYDQLRRLDVVHDHTMAGPQHAARFTDIPVITTNHGPFGGDLLAHWRRIGQRVPIVAISHHQAATAPEVPVAAVIHHGIDVDGDPDAAGSTGTRPLDARRELVFLGRMAPCKGARTAIEVARAAGVPIRLAAKMREPEERAYFDAEVRPLLGPDAEYVGEVGGADKQALLAGALALVNPIRWPEPFGLVMIEALAAGTPVLAFPEGAAPEIVEHGRTGFLCPDVGAMVDAVGRVRSLDPRACREAVVARFSTQRMVADHVALFTRVLERWPETPARWAQRPA